MLAGLSAGRGRIGLTLTDIPEPIDTDPNDTSEDIGLVDPRPGVDGGAEQPGDGPCTDADGDARCDEADNCVGLEKRGPARSVRITVTYADYATPRNILNLSGSAQVESASASHDIVATGWPGAVIYVNGVRGSTLDSDWCQVVITGDGLEASQLAIRPRRRGTTGFSLRRRPGRGRGLRTGPERRAGGSRAPKARLRPLNLALRASLTRA